MKKLNPSEFETQFNMRDASSCVDCQYATDYDYSRYLTCNHPLRENPIKIKDCGDYICNEFK